MLDLGRNFIAPLYVFMNVSGQVVVADILLYYAQMELEFSAKSILRRRDLTCGIFMDDSLTFISGMRDSD